MCWPHTRCAATAKRLNTAKHTLQATLVHETAVPDNTHTQTSPWASRGHQNTHVCTHACTHTSLNLISLSPTWQHMVLPGSAHNRGGGGEVSDKTHHLGGMHFAAPSLPQAALPIAAWRRLGGRTNCLGIQGSTDTRAAHKRQSGGGGGTAHKIITLTHVTRFGVELTPAALVSAPRHRHTATGSSCPTAGAVRPRCG